MHDFLKFANVQKIEEVEERQVYFHNQDAFS